jgi:hypothetical protein
VGHAGVVLDSVGPDKKIYGTIKAWRNRPIEGDHPYVLLGRRGAQRLAAGCDGRERARSSGDFRHLRGGEGK